MVNFVTRKAVFVAYPLGNDFTFVYWYLIRFTGASPFNNSGIDISTYAMASLKKEHFDSTREGLPANWLSENPNLHLALDNAIDQGVLFCNMLIANQNRSA